ncbi:hypothetical protein [Solibacillus sp. FSL K6-1523]|uniref:hypothetical protein n=1 Tax=Solibacillus sp. FSL K6-1523 TaxID=2921471 RepID=UPI0030F86394
MNKKLLIAAATIPVIVTVPNVVGAEEVSAITIEGKNTVNETLKASIGSLGNTIIKGYQWYYVETEIAENSTDSPTRKPIPGATAISFTVPAEAAGKKVMVEATSTEGTVYKSSVSTINKLALEITEPKLTGYSESKIVAPGETIKVGGAVVTDNNGASLKNNQITYSYEWFSNDGDAFTIINGATSENYSIPVGALEKGMEFIKVRVTAKVGTFVVESSISDFVTISNAPSEALITAIEKLRISDGKYNITESLDKFKAEVEEINDQYKALAPPAKANVKNYAIVERALADIKMFSALNDKMNKLGEIDAGDRPKYIQGIEADYDKLDLLQRSLDVGDTLYDSILKIMEAPTDLDEIEKVRNVSQAIAELINYNGNLVQYAPTNANVEDLQKAIDAIETDIASISKSYQTTVQNLNILDDAKQDIKKIAQFVKLFDKLSGIIAPEKQVTTAKSIRTAYEKLTYKQRQLVPAENIMQLLAAENAEEFQIEDLNDAIKSYIGDDIYPINLTEQTWHDYVADVNRIISQYKSLTKTSAAKIISYTEIVQLQKDFKTADKVNKQIKEYDGLSQVSGVKESKLKSSYNSALKAYNKLTSLQQSLVYNEDLLLNNPPNVTIDDKGKEPADKAAAEALKADLAKLANVTNYSFTTLEQAVNTATAAYKNLSSAARKHVTNYYLLTAASKDVKAVASFHKKVQTAGEEMNVAKQAKKIETVEKAFAKLPANQQHLANEQYQQLLDNRLVDGSAADIGAFNNAIGGILSKGLYVDTVTVEYIKTLSLQYKNLSASDKKRITNAAILKTAEADVKKVESFMKQYDKSFSSNPATVRKAFAKLSAKQVGLVNDTVRDAIIASKKAEQGANEAGFAVVESIDTLLIKGVYKSNLQVDVLTIRVDYDKLSAAEKKVVNNYSRLTQAEADLKKVAEVHALYEAIPEANGDTARKAWKTAFGKLSKKLELLYKDMYKGDN